MNTHEKIIQQLCEEFGLPKQKVKQYINAIHRAMLKLINQYPDSLIIKDFGGFYATKIINKHRLRRITIKRKKKNESQKKFWKKNPEKNNPKRFLKKLAQEK